MRARPRRDGERGFVLLLVLYGLALVGAAALAIGFTGRSETLAARNAVEASVARNAAEAGVQLGIRRVLDRARRGDMAVPAPESLRVGAASVVVAIADEEGKIDLNEAPFELLAGALISAGDDPLHAETVACRIVARRGWADPRCTVEEGPRGLLRAVEEVSALGVPDMVFRRLLPLATVYSGSSAIDPRTAPLGALVAVPTLGQSEAESLIARREQAAALGMPLDEAEVPRDRRWYAVSSRRTWTVSAAATTPGGGRARAEMVLRLTGLPTEPYTVAAWRQPRS